MVLLVLFLFGWILISWTHILSSLISELRRLNVILLFISNISLLLLHLLSPLVVELNVLIMLVHLSIVLLTTPLSLNIILLLIILSSLMSSIYEFIHLLELIVSCIKFIIPSYPIIIFCLILFINIVFFITIWISFIIIFVIIIRFLNLLSKPWTSSLLIINSSKSLSSSWRQIS